MFLYCYFATRTSVFFSALGDVAYNAHWHKFRIEYQKFLILIIRQSQVPLQFNGLGIFICDLETFGNVRKFQRSIEKPINSFNFCCFIRIDIAFG